MRKFLVVLAVCLGSSFPSAVEASQFKDCAALIKKYPNGVAKSSSAAKQQTFAPKVSSDVYKKYSKLDLDKDGTACEKVGSATGANPLGGSAPEDFLMPNVICMTLQEAQDEIQDHGVFSSRSKDATGKNRGQWNDSNWIVVKQSPAPGKKISEGSALLSAVKKGESTGGLCK
jgi:hypothetical protein